MLLLDTVHIALLICTGGLAGMTGYLLLLTGAAWFAARHTPFGDTAGHQFVFLVPAHNEERLLPGLLENLHQIDYPAAGYAIHVIADNCVDNTATVARQGGAVVHERFDNQLIGKGFALKWALERLGSQNVTHDAIVIVDADTVVSRNFLRVIDTRLARGERAIQAYYAVRDPERSWSASLRSVALAALHYLRPQGRMVLGGSAGLKGNGMVFTAEIARTYPWPGSLTEDIEYHMALIAGGVRVTFAPDAVVYAEMPGSLAAAQTQNTRWERGRLEMLRRYVPGLLGAAVKRRNFMLFDAAVEQILPPFTLLPLLGALGVLAALALGDAMALALASFAIVGQLAYVFASLFLARVPRKVYQALLYAPLFVGWKLWLYLCVVLGIGPKSWVRTARNE